MAKFFIHRPVTAIVLSLLILLIGGISIFRLPIAQYPQIAPPTVEVEINYPGAMPVEMDDGEGCPSRWNTLRALRVLEWYSALN